MMDDAAALQCCQCVGGRYIDVHVRTRCVVVANGVCAMWNFW
jgi:hypothetical protein